ncbi:TPA: metal ABC transporter ATPase, partial [Pseudomonas aeruginosa]|nr:metal ABC transporter ATPase [Pseudomonas aeruginosa]
GQLRPAATRGLWLAESFAVQDGWLVHEERIRFRDWLALWPSSNGDQAGGGRDRASA